MSYISKYGRRPCENASKASHSFIINDEHVKEYLEQCNLPKLSDEILIDDKYLISIDYPKKNIIENLIAVDGGYQDIPVRKSFPSSTVAFFQFGALMLNVKELEDLSDEPFISPDAMSKLKELERKKLVIPTKNVALKKFKTITKSIRKTLNEYFNQDKNGESMNETLYWFLFQMYDKKVDQNQLASCPVCDDRMIRIRRNSINKDFTFSCPSCKGKLYLTDFFRLHEAIDDELGASGILGYLTNLVEQLIIIHTIRSIIRIQPNLLHKLLFIKDGPLAFFGQTANMHTPMRTLCNYLIKKHGLFLVGLEKSGAFVEHADEIRHKLKPGQILLLSNKYIYTYILPGDPETTDPYARSSYYSSKLIFKSRDEKMYVMSIPTATEDVVLNPKVEDFANLNMILLNIEKLRCDMYDNALLPIAVVNKLVSLSNHPSAVLLEKFARGSING